MKVICDDLWLCVDCLFAAVNGDMPTDSTPERDAAIETGLIELGPHLVPDFDSETGDGHEEFKRGPCDCCGSPLAGEFHRFAVLGEGEEDKPAEDYESCGECGFDHGYEQAEAAAAHKESEQS